MANLMQASRVYRLQPGVAAPFVFFGIMLPADTANTTLVVTTLQDGDQTWADGELTPGVVYPIAGTAITGATQAATVTIFGA